MAKVKFTEALRQEYENLFNSCIIRPERFQAVEELVTIIKDTKDRYLGVSIPLGIPWGFIAVIHNMEASLNFMTHLHNGDPLTARTVQVPENRPRKGHPPFTWEEMEAHVRRVLNSWGRRPFVLGIADQIPPNGNIDFCRRIADIVGQ